MYNKLLNLIQFNSMDGWIDGWMDPSLIPNLILIPMVKEDLVFQRQSLHLRGCSMTTPITYVSARMSDSSN